MYRALAAIKYHRLFHNSETCEALSLTRANTCLEFELYVEAYCYAIKAAGELNGLNRDGRGADLSRFGADLRCMFNDALSELIEENTSILEAVAVTTGVKHLIGVDNNAAAVHAADALACAEDAVSVVSHIDISILSVKRIKGSAVCSPMLYWMRPCGRILIYMVCGKDRICSALYVFPSFESIFRHTSGASGLLSM